MLRINVSRLWPGGFSLSPTSTSTSTQLSLSLSSSHSFHPTNPSPPTFQSLSPSLPPQSNPIHISTTSIPPILPVAFAFAFALAIHVPPSNDAMRKTLTDRDPSHALTQGSDSSVWYQGAESMLAGAGAGLVTSVVTCPLDVIKTKLQAGGGRVGGPKGMAG